MVEQRGQSHATFYTLSWVYILIIKQEFIFSDLKCRVKKVIKKKHFSFPGEFGTKKYFTPLQAGKSFTWKGKNRKNLYGDQREDSLKSLELSF